MKIGITCYPTYGGSGVVATELGMELAARGHEIHFISYAPPVRLNSATQRHRLPRSGSFQLSAFRSRALLADARRENDGGGRIRARSICCTCITPFPIRSARCWRAPWPRPRRLPFITTLHGTDITLVGNNRSFLPITQIFHRAIRRRHRDLALPEESTRSRNSTSSGPSR